MKDPKDRLINGEDDLRRDYRHPIPISKLKHGSLKGKTPVPLSDGRTVIYVRKGKSKRKAKDFFENLIKERR